MKYIDIDFPQELSRCFNGGAEFSTSIAITKNKQEIRNKNWFFPRYKYTLQYKYCNKEIFQKLQSFFLICNGSEMCFNYLDNTDYTLNNEIIAVSNGINTSYQIYKTYSYNNKVFQRKITKIKNANIYINNSLLDTDKYNINNGIITFINSYIPEKNSIISITAIFYVIVRFDIDFLPVAQKQFNSVELPDISLIETNI